MHLDCRAVRRFAHPYIKILAFARFEEDDIVAVVKFGELVELVKLGFRVEFALAPAVREQAVEVVK